MNKKEFEVKNISDEVLNLVSAGESDGISISGIAKTVVLGVATTILVDIGVSGVKKSWNDLCISSEEWDQYKKKSKNAYNSSWFGKARQFGSDVYVDGMDRLRKVIC